MDAVTSSVEWAVFNKVCMVLMISWCFSARSSFNSFFFCGCIFLCFNCVVIITLVMNVAFVEESIFSLRFIVSMNSSYHGCNNFFFCLSGVQASVYGFTGLFRFLCALWFQWFLPFMHALVSSFVQAVSLLSHMVWWWFWWKSLPRSLRTMVSMSSSFYGCCHFFLCLSSVKESVYGFNEFFLFLCALWFQVPFSLTL